MNHPTKLYHVTTLKKYLKYKQSNCIHSPVRGFTTPMAAMAWAIKTGRNMILEVETYNTHKLPDHHNQFGEAWWNDGNTPNFTVFYAAT